MCKLLYILYLTQQFLYSIQTSHSLLLLTDLPKYILFLVTHNMTDHDTITMVMVMLRKIDTYIFL